MTFFVQALAATLLTALLIIWLRRPAQRFDLLDHAGGRKRHGASIPLTGGIAIGAGFALTVLFSAHVLSHYAILLVAMALLAVVGLLDDLGEVSPRGKLGAELVAALLMTSWAGHYLTGLGDIVARGPVELLNWGIPLTVFATIAVINGLNMLDGLDGLAGGLAFVILAFFAYFARWVDDVYAYKFLLVLLGAVGGFLLFNLPHPWRGNLRTFMGDTGSLILGFVIAWFSVELSQRPGAQIPPVVMLWVVGLVLLDLLTVTLRRILRRRDPALPDRGHVHHMLLRRGVDQVGTLAWLLAGNLALGMAGVAFWRLGLPEYLSFGAFLAVAVLYLAMFLLPSRRWFRRQRLRRRREDSVAADDEAGPADNTGGA